MTKSTEKKTEKTAAATAAVTEPLKAAQGFYAKLFEAGKLAVSGTIELDKMILNHIADTAKGTVEHGRTVLGAKDLKTVVDLQAAFIQNSVEKNIAYTKDVAEFAQTKAQEMISPFKEKAA